VKQKKWLFRAASGMVATILLTLPAYAAEPNITITDNAPSGSIYQLQPEAEKAPVPSQKGTTTPYPIDIQLSEQSSRSFLYKTYTVAADYAPDQLVEDPFSQGGYHFRFSEIIQRDYDDSHRAAAPLRRAEDAVEVDTSALNLEESLEALYAVVKERAGR